MPRLRDEAVLYNMICVAELYAKRVGDELDLARVCLIRVEHVYYKVRARACMLKLQADG